MKTIKIIALISITVATVTVSETAQATKEVSDQYDLAWAAKEAGNFKQCLSYAIKAEKDDPQSAERPFLVGLCAERVGKFKESYRAFLRSRDLNPDDPDVYRNLVVLAVKKVDLKNARQHLRQLKARFSNDPRVNEMKRMLKNIEWFIADNPKLTLREIRGMILRMYCETRQCKTPEVANAEK